MHIYRATRGKYLKPIPISEAGLNWVNEEEQPTTEPKVLRCNHPDHSERKLKFLFGEMYYQPYHLTAKEMKEAVAQWDMASLEMRGMVICVHCAVKNKNKNP